MRKKVHVHLLRIAVAAFVVMAMSLPVLADGLVPGVSFTGGDGSYKRALHEGIIVGITPDPPHTFTDQKTKQADGVDVRIFNEVARRLGITKVTWQDMPFDSIIPAILAKRIDIVIDDIHENPKRLKVIAFTSPVFYYGIRIAVRKGNPDKIASWQSLAGHVVGVLRGSFQFDSLAARKDLKDLKAYNFSEGGLSDLSVGRVDAVVDDAVTILGYIKAHPGINIDIAPGAETTFPQGLDYLGQARWGLRQDDVDLNHAISRTLEEMRADGTVLKIITPYGMTAQNILR
jgi:polar amino acid transport system substrate-binding protein